MKNLVILTIASLLVACSGNTKQTSTTDSTTVEAVATDSLSIEMDSVNAEIVTDSVK
jgi:uncharacterized protein YcfL